MKWSHASIAFAVSVLLVGATIWTIHATQEVGIRVLPPTISMKLYPGEHGSYELKVHNGMGVNVTARLSIRISLVPAGGLTNYISLEYPNSIALKQGNSRVIVLVSVDRQALPGAYVLSNSVSL